MLNTKLISIFSYKGEVTSVITRIKMKRKSSNIKPEDFGEPGSKRRKASHRSDSKEEKKVIDLSDEPVDLPNESKETKRRTSNRLIHRRRYESKMSSVDDSDDSDTGYGEPLQGQPDEEPPSESESEEEQNSDESEEEQDEPVSEVEKAKQYLEISEDQVVEKKESHDEKVAEFVGLCGDTAEELNLTNDELYFQLMLMHCCGTKTAKETLGHEYSLNQKHIRRLNRCLEALKPIRQSIKAWMCKMEQLDQARKGVDQLS